MAARTNRTGEWCTPTREIPNSRLIRLIDESRDRAAAVERIHDAPPHPCPANALERVERARCNSMLVDLRALADPDALAIEPEEAAPDPGPATLESEPEVEEATVTLMYAPVTNHARPLTTALAQSIAIDARHGSERVTSGRLLLWLGVLVALWLGVLVFLGLGTWGA